MYEKRQRCETVRILIPQTRRAQNPHPGCAVTVGAIASVLPPPTSARSRGTRPQVANCPLTCSAQLTPKRMPPNYPDVPDRALSAPAGASLWPGGASADTSGRNRLTRCPTRSPSSPQHGPTQATQAVTTGSHTVTARPHAATAGRSGRDPARTA